MADSAWQEAYKGACESLRIIEKAQCKTCAGFGYVNQDSHHASNRDKKQDVGCKNCAGTGFAQNLELKDLI